MRQMRLACHTHRLSQARLQEERAALSKASQTARLNFNAALPVLIVCQHSLAGAGLRFGDALYGV
eukprot:COSAG04_NODE_6295_length_1363_cov_1.035601_1_plen_64_part_10